MTNEADRPTLWRRALATCDPVAVREVVDQLNLQPGARVDVVVVAPLRQLRRGGDVTSFAETAPLAAVRFLVEVLTQDALARVVELLGDAAAEPTLEQLAGAVDEMAGEFANSLLAAMLAAAAASGVPAEPHCRELLATRPEFALRELSAPVASGTLLQTKSVDPEVREQRRRRRELERQQRQRQQSRPPTRPPRARPSGTHPLAPPAPSTTEAPAITRRRVLLTPREASEFELDHPLAGCVVEVEVPFNDGPDEFGATGKIRPALVLAGSDGPDGALLVRPIFSQPAPGRQLLVGWNRIGLDHASYVDLARVRVVPGPSPRRFGTLSDDEWNALL